MSVSPLPAFVSQPFYEVNQPRALIAFPFDLPGLTFIVDSYAITGGIHGASDTATFTLPNKNNPDWTTALYRGNDTGNANTPVYVQIFSGFQQGTTQATKDSLSLRFYGVVDQYEIDLGPPNDTATFTCRSLAAPLIDTKIVTPLAQNLTTTAFIQQWTSKFNMPAPIIHLLAPAVTMQQVLAQELVAGVHSYSLWEMFVRASLADDADVWVDTNGTVNYQARTRQRPTPDVILTWGRDLKAAKLTHSPQFSKNVQVDIKIYNPQTKSSTISRAVLSDDGTTLNTIQGTRVVTSQKIPGTLSTVTQSYSQNSIDGAPLPVTSATTTVTTAQGGAFNASSSEGKVGGDSGKERYVLWIKGGTTPAQALAMARQQFLEISQHEYNAQLTVPITQALIGAFNINKTIQLKGVPYVRFVGPYWPRQVHEIYGKNELFRWEISAINHAPPQGLGTGVS